jgi:hypothetical protein
MVPVGRVLVVFPVFIVIAAVPMTIGIVKSFMMPAVFINIRLTVVVMVVLDATAGVTDTDGHRWQPAETQD